MVQQAQGYRTSSGVFFESELDALLFETREQLEVAATPTWSVKNGGDCTFNHMLMFIEHNAATVHAYCSYYLKKYEEEGEDSDELQLPLEG